MRGSRRPQRDAQERHQAGALADVSDYLAAWYRPGNAVLAVTGDVTPDRVFSSAERYFGPVPAGVPAAAPHGLFLGPLAAPVRDHAFAAVPFAAVALGWRLPAASAERDALTALSSSAGRAACLPYYAAAFDDPALIRGAADRILAVTAGQVQDAARTWLRPDCAATVTTSPAPASAGPSARE